VRAGPHQLTTSVKAPVRKTQHASAMFAALTDEFLLLGFSFFFAPNVLPERNGST